MGIQRARDRIDKERRRVLRIIQCRYQTQSKMADYRIQYAWLRASKFSDFARPHILRKIPEGCRRNLENHAVKWIVQFGMRLAIKVGEAQGVHRHRVGACETFAIPHTNRTHGMQLDAKEI